MMDGRFEIKIPGVSMMVMLAMLALVMTTATAATAAAAPGNEIVFVLGTDVNKDALQNAASNDTIASGLNITIYSMNDTVAQDFNFPDYQVIFIESQDKSMVMQWGANIIAARESGSEVIGYNLYPATDLSNATLPNITLSNIDLRSSEYTDIERYWVQGGDTNMENMLKFMGQKFCDAWANETIPEPELLRSKINITYILNYETDNYYLIKVLGERSVITDRFTVTVMDGAEAAAANLTALSDVDVIMLGMIGANQFPEFKDALLAAKDNGTQIGLIGNSVDTYGVSNLDMENSILTDYHKNGGYTNMENWIRCIGATLEDAYIEYSPAVPPSIPDHGIYHPDAFPMIFENSTEYLVWYADHGYNASAPTIGIITNKLAKDKIYYTTDNAIIRDLESKGCNVIYTTSKVCSQDVDYFTRDKNVLVDSIISLNAFYLNYGDQEQGVEYLKNYNVPVLKGVLDHYNTPDEYNASQRGLDLMSIPFQVTQPEIDGCIDYIWIAGQVKDPATEQSYYEPLMPRWTGCVTVRSHGQILE